MIQEIIEKNKEYFKGIEITNGMVLVRVVFKDKWGVYPSKDETIQVAKSKDNQNEWYYYGNYDTVNIDDIFNLIEETIKMNIEAASKLELLNNKFEELKTIFSNEPLDKLKALKFVFDDKLIVKPKRKYTRHKKIEKEQEVEKTAEQDNINKEDMSENDR